MTKKWFVIINPAAAQRELEEHVPALTSFFKEHLVDVTIELTKEKGHAIELTINAIQQGYRQIIAVGGDGTNHEVVNGILTQDVVPSPLITYALLPLGTGNDWAKYYNIPRQWDTWLQMLKAGNTTLQDVGLLQYTANGKREKRYFTNVAGLAYDGYVVSKIAQFSSSNPIFYLLSVLKYLLTYKPQAGTISYDGQQVSNRFYTINIGICKYSGGGMQFVPHAIADDGKLALTIAHKMSPLYVLISAWRFYTSRLLSHPKVEGHQVSQIRIESNDSPILLEADGEFLGETPVDISIEHKALCVVNLR